jgi:hypothetical protein
MDALMRLMRAARHDAINTWMFDAEAYCRTKRKMFERGCGLPVCLADIGCTQAKKFQCNHMLRAHNMLINMSRR